MVAHTSEFLGSFWSLKTSDEPIIVLPEILLDLQRPLSCLLEMRAFLGIPLLENSPVLFVHEAKWRNDSTSWHHLINHQKPERNKFIFGVFSKGLEVIDLNHTKWLRPWKDKTQYDWFPGKSQNSFKFNAKFKQNPTMSKNHRAFLNILWG